MAVQVDYLTTTTPSPENTTATIDKGRVSAVLVPDIGYVRRLRADVSTWIASEVSAEDSIPAFDDAEHRYERLVALASALPDAWGDDLPEDAQSRAELTGALMPMQAETMSEDDE